MQIKVSLYCVLYRYMIEFIDFGYLVVARHAKTIKFYSEDNIKAINYTGVELPSAFCV